MLKLAVCALVLLAACNAVAQPNQRDPWADLKLGGYTKNGLAITLQKRSYVFDPRGGSELIGGECINRSGEHLRACVVRLEVLDRDGAKVGGGVASVSDLARDQRWRFDALVTWSKWALVGEVRVSDVTTSPALAAK